MSTEKEGLKFDFWNDHSLEFLEMAMKRDFQERLETFDGYGSKTRECGDTIEFFLIEDKGILKSISYDVKGCIYSHACANALIHLVKGKKISDAENLKEADIISMLKTLPLNEAHCARLALGAFNMALQDLG